MKKENKDKKNNKLDDKKLYSSVWKRIVAFIIDALIISILASLVCLPFTNTKNEAKLEDEFINNTQKYYKNEIDVKAYKDIQVSYTYNIAKESGLIRIVTILLGILYYGLYQFLMKGQTLGKKLMHIRIKSDDGDLTLNQLLFRSLIVNSIILDLILFVAMLFMNKNSYYYSVLVFELIQYIIYFICFVMIIKNKKKKGLHDVLFHTHVIVE